MIFGEKKKGKKIIVRKEGKETLMTIEICENRKNLKKCEKYDKVQDFLGLREYKRRDKNTRLTKNKLKTSNSVNQFLYLNIQYI